MIPCKSDIDKKNRNLYAILLINQMVNGKLEEPFIKFANSFNDLKQLSPENIKAELTKKFYEERRNRFSKNRIFWICKTSSIYPKSSKCSRILI